MDNAQLKSQSNPLVSIAAFLIITAVIMYASSIITPILLALFITIVCAQPIRWLQERKVPKWLAVLLVLLLMLGILFGLGEVIGRSIVQFSNDIGFYATRINEIMTSVLNYAHGMGFDVSIDKLETMISPSRIVNFSATFLSAIGNLMSNMFLIVFYIIFMLLEINSFNTKVLAVTTNSGNESISYITRITHSIRQYLGLMTIVSLLTGVCVYVALLIIGVDYPILWALIAFLFNFIPNIGSIIASIPAILFAMIQLGTGGALWTLISYISINMIIGNVVQPPLMGKGLGLSTLVVFISLIFWGYVLGTIGMFLSVPLTMVLKIGLEQKHSTKWMALMLGTEKEAQESINSMNEPK